MKNLLTGGTGMGIDQRGVRAKLRYQPNAQFTATFSMDYNKDRSPGQLGFNLGPGSYLKSFTLPNQPILTNRLKSLANGDPTSDGTNYGANLKLEYDTGSVVLTSLTQARKSRFHDRQDNDGVGYDDLHQDGKQDAQSYSQELRASSEQGGFGTFDGRLTWQAGLFYFHQKSAASDIFELGPDSFVVANLAHHLVNDTIGSALTTESYAAYGEATFKITQQLSLTAGIRYSHDKKTGTETGATDSPGFPFVTAPFSVPVTSSSHATNPKFTLSYAVTPDFNVYAGYSQGYKSGGFQYLATTPAIAALVYGPETVDNYEAGVKSQWFDRRLTLNVAAFKAKYKGLQLGRSIGTSFFTDNAAAVDLRGVEAEARAVLPHGFSVEATYTYLDNKFSSYNQCTALSAAGCGIFDGTVLPRSPKNELNLGGEYKTDVGSDSDLTLRADMTYRSKYILDAGGLGGTLPGGAPYPDNANLVQKDLTLLDMRATFRHGDWRLAVWGTNLTNKIYGSALVNTPSLKVAGNEIGNTTIIYWAPPRMFGATLSYSF
jgi:iron complex outermembrane receptor protein